MKHLLLLLILPLFICSFRPAVSNEPEAVTYLKLYTTVTGTGDSKTENWLLANNGTRRILATIEIVPASEDQQKEKERKDVIVEAKSSLPLGIRTASGSTPNNIVIIKAVFTPQP